MKIICIYIFGMVTGFVFSWFIFKNLNLSEIMKIHGLQSAKSPENLVIDQDSNDDITPIPLEAELYFDKYFPEGFIRCFIFVNVEKTKLDFKKNWRNISINWIC